MLLLNQSLLILLQPLELHLLLSNQLNRELTSLIDDGKISLFLSLASSRPLHNAIKHYRAGIDVVNLEELLADGDLASKDGMDIQSQQLADDQLHLSCYQPLLNHWISGNIEMRLIEVLSRCPQDVLILLLIIFIIQRLLQGLLFLCESIQLLGRDHCVNMGHIAQRGCHEGGQHFWISQYVLIEGNWIIWVTQLGLTVSEDASDSD